MLKEINCNKFIKSKIEFSCGLNSIIGDNISTNSIGKSTFLMILDFVFGGNTFKSKDSGSIKHVGDLTLNFCYIFNNEKYYYSRDTENPEIVNICDSNYTSLEEISVIDYTNKLLELYNFDDNQTSFRDIVSLFSRIWGKENYNVDKPLLSFPKESDEVSITRLIKLFGYYNEINDASKKLKDKKDSKKFLNGAIRKNYIPNITKTTFVNNQKHLETIESEIADIKENILKLSLNIEELVNKDTLELKLKKSNLLKEQEIILNKIQRIDLNINQKRIKSKHLDRLSTFFENPNEEKIEEIENFHNKISSILTRELKASKEILEKENEYFISAIEEIDIKISNLLESISSPKYIVDKIYDLTIEANRLKSENKYYQEKIDIAEDVKNIEIDFEKLVIKILTDIEIDINNELININETIHNKEKKIPKIKLNRKSYTYDHSSNTGTGKSFADLIEFDLAILYITILPFLIHDSVLFKNIEDVTMDRIIELYSKSKKQIFISIDGINKFSSKSKNILKETEILELTKDNKLFNTDWS
ncbi:hypothetical protein HX082_02890 [Myroides odoratimimus]|uniref:DUF2326 domain-containing protein n=1 Tax=Myroides odoratimimus TaxID=76832 RepID=UPI0025761F42|nr:DUF2326 domain-containing protein [Myroides odoratimimus]MDM1508340.1 hypothetical protein [Myroides odoratimimus]